LAGKSGNLVVVRPLKVVIVAGPSRAAYLGRSCPHWLGLIVTQSVCDIDGVNFDYVDITIPLILVERSLKLDSLPTTLPSQRADSAAIGNRVPSDSYYLVSTSIMAACSVGSARAMRQFL
jgi:hypothetical protein